jgi:hypothetical protein
MCVGGFYKIDASVFTSSIMPSVIFLKPSFILFLVTSVLLYFCTVLHPSPFILHLAQVYFNFLSWFHFLPQKIFENVKLLQKTSMDRTIQYNKGIFDHTK